MTGVSQDKKVNPARIEELVFIFCTFGKPPLTTLLGSEELSWLTAFVQSLLSQLLILGTTCKVDRKQIAISGFGVWRDSKVLTVLVFGSRRDTLV